MHQISLDREIIVKIAACSVMRHLTGGKREYFNVHSDNILLKLSINNVDYLF